jgi:hypothetical protein
MGWGIFDAPLGSDPAGSRSCGRLGFTLFYSSKNHLNGVFSFGNIMSKTLRWLSLRSISLLHSNLL